jgi:hypothetical protein
MLIEICRRKQVSNNRESSRTNLVVLYKISLQKSKQSCSNAKECGNGYLLTLYGNICAVRWRARWASTWNMAPKIETASVNSFELVESVKFGKTFLGTLTRYDPHNLAHRCPQPDRIIWKKKKKPKNSIRCTFARDEVDFTRSLSHTRARTRQNQTMNERSTKCTTCV